MTEGLRIEGLSKTYPNGVKALSNITLDIPRGMFGLLGPNGAGKSSLMRTIATLQDPNEGSIHLDDLDVLANKQALRQTLGYLPQEFGTYPRTSPMVMLNHLAVLKGIGSKPDRAALIEKLLVQTNLFEVRNKNLDTFSGGMRQRFGIAQALIGTPELIIVDEPTAGLDPAERRRFHNLLAQIGQDVVVILSTHIVEDVADLCSRMAIMGEGKILVEGEPQAMLEQLCGRLWKKNVSWQDLDEAKKSLPVISTRRIGSEMEIRVVAGSSPEPGMSETQPTMEDVYFATLDQHGIDVDLDKGGENVS
jgi:ABC-type multidrug transport system ATPase subunit